MSTTAEQTRYMFSFSVAKGDNTDNGTLTLTSDTGVTDAVALSLAEAFNGLAWPAGTVAAAWVTKHDVTEVQSEGDLSATPHAFT